METQLFEPHRRSSDRLLPVLYDYIIISNINAKAKGQHDGLLTMTTTSVEPLLSEYFDGDQYAGFGSIIIL